MSSVIVEDDKFPDIVVQFILDYMMTDDMIPDNDNWSAVVKKMEGAGMKTILLQYYLNTNAIEKSKYKDIKKIFHGGSRKETINIVDQIPNVAKTKPKGISKIIKRVLKLIKSHRERHYGMPLNEETIDQIIDKVLKESTYTQNRSE